MTTTYEWTDGNATVIGSGNTLQLNESVVSPGDAVNCTATVEDVHGDTDSMMTSVMIDNSIPTIDSPAVISGTPTTSETLTCSAAFSDLNDGALSPAYVWTKSDGTILSSTDSYTIDANETDVGDSLTCTASVIDADGDTISRKQRNDTKHTTDPGWCITFLPIITSDDVTCSVTGVDDIDGDSVSLSYEYGNGNIQLKTRTHLQVQYRLPQ